MKPDVCQTISRGFSPGRSTRIVRWLFSSWGFSALVALAITPSEVRQQLDAGKKMLIVDVRATTLFKNGHIPNAINIPAALVPEKQLPPLGRVVVYDEGLGQDAAQTAAAALNRKQGITAEALEGGFAAWQMTPSVTTQSGGLRPEALPLITYQELKQKTNADVVLVDLRQPRSRASARAAETRAAAPLTPLQSEFPHARIAHSPFNAAAPTQARAARSTTPPLLVLVDNGDGQAEEMARALKAGGHTRFVILAGGESILERKGERGLQRAGATFNVRPPLATQGTNTHR